MAFTFKPAIYKNSVLYELPQPVLAVRVQDAWDFEQFKVPLADGDFLTGHSQQGVGISVEGQIGEQSGSPKALEQAMFAEIETLRTALDITSDSDKFEFFLYHDTSSSTYRKFKSCSTVRFDYDLSDKNLFAYSIVIHAEDPVIYTTEPGS